MILKTFAAAAIMLLMAAHAHGGAIDVVISHSFGTTNTRAPGSFNYPSGLAVDSVTGDIFIVDQFFSRVQRFDAYGNYILEWAENGGIGIAVDTADQSVYMANAARNKIVKYSPTGQVIREWGTTGAATGQFDSPFDVAVNPITRNVYVADANNKRIQEFTSDGMFVRQFSHSSFSLVYGVAVDPTGQYIYVSDAGMVRMHKFDANGNHLLAWSSIGNNLGQLRWPRGVTVAANGDVIVASTDNHELVRFDANGNYLQSFRGPNDTVSGGFHPRAVDVNLVTGEIFAPASYAHRIDRFNAAGGYLSSWGFSDTTGYHFNRPSGVAIDPVSGDIFVADTWNNKFKRFSSTGVFEMEWGTGLACAIYSDATTVNFPSRIGVDALGKVWTFNGATYYADDLARWSDKYVRLYDLDGNHVFSFGSPGLTNGMSGIAMDPTNNEIYVVNTRRHKILVFNYNGTLQREFGSQGSGPGQFSFPAGIALDSVTNTIFVVDSGHQRIQKLDTNGNHILSFGSAGNGQGQFSLDSQSDISIDNYGHIFVADTYNNRIQIFDLDGRFLKSFGSSGTGNGFFRFPSAVTVSGTTVAVADTYNFQIKIYNIIPLPDQDNDNIADSSDNCVAVANFDQLDTDGDGRGDVCDPPDQDNDGVADSLDNCISIANPNQTDTDGDWQGNACDLDDDNDGLPDVSEISIGTNPLLADSDGDGMTDYLEVAWDSDATRYTPGLDLNPLAADTDGDGLLDGSDTTPLAYNADTVWLEDAIPAGASRGGTWNFIGANPAPYSGSLAHQEVLAAGTHQHYFYGASSTLSIGTGNILFAYVYLDPTNPPSEVLLQWYERTSWHHRAYWGANKIDWGTNGTVSRYYMGALPPTGGWVRLEVPASAVGLEGKVINGMAFTLYDGKATWDYAGKSTMPFLPRLQFSSVNYQTVEGSGTAILVITRTGNNTTPVSVNYTTVGGTATAGADYTTTSGTLNFAAWENSKTISIPIIDDAVADGGETLTVTLNSPVNATVSSVGTATVTIADNEYGVSGRVTLDGASMSGVSFTASGTGMCTVSDGAGVFRCTVPPGWSGTIFPTGDYRFRPAWRSYANVGADVPSQDFSATSQTGTIWLEDAVPAGASTVGTWNFISANPAPFSGSLAHQEALAAGTHQHYFSGASSKLTVNVGDALFTYVYLDPANPPAEVMLQWREGTSWEHRAYWGENKISWGTNGTASRYYMGPLPPTGGWMRLEVPASMVGLEGKVLNGMAFTLYDGRATWDYAGKY